MRKITYFYNAIVKTNENCDSNSSDKYYVDIYCTNGKKRICVGQMFGVTPTDTLKLVRDLMDVLNVPKPFFGNNGQIDQWWWFFKKTWRMRK